MMKTSPTDDSWQVTWEDAMKEANEDALKKNQEHEEEMEKMRLEAEALKKEQEEKERIMREQ